MAFVESDAPYETRIKVLEPRSNYEANLYWQRAESEVRAMIRMYAEYMLEFGDMPWRTSQYAEPLVDADIRQLAF